MHETGSMGRISKVRLLQHLLFPNNFEPKLILEDPFKLCHKYDKMCFLCGSAD